jgi:citrate lyase subunit beta/citryl-CoA lyase
MIARSLLFVPADRPDRYAKALGSGADEVIVDLEDAVAAERKATARDSLRTWLATATAPVLVRVNGVESEWFDEDLALCAYASVGGIMLPKAESAVGVARVVDVARGKRVLPLIETARGIDAARELAAVRGVDRLAFGNLDFMIDMGIEDTHDALLHFRSQLVLASRLAGCLPPVDGVTTSFDDLQAVAADATRARALGFGGKLCIHPRQVKPINRAFTPDARTRAWARRVVEAIERSGGAAVAVDGKMVDRPVLLRAQRILEQSREGPNDGA